MSTPTKNRLDLTLEVLHAVRGFAREHGLSIEKGGIYLPADWAQRGEEYCLGAVLIITYDGGAMRRACSLDGFDYKLNKAFQAMLRKHGCYFEEGTSWYGGIYEVLS